MKYIHPKKAIRLVREFLCFDLPFYLIPDKCYLSWKYKLIFHRPIDWKNPQTFSEKLNWLKIYDRKPIYHQLVDKLRVKPIVADIIGEEHIIPTIAGPFKSVDEIYKDQLPKQFVLKCNHDSASVIVCRDKAHFDWDSAKSKLSECMRHDYYKFTNREWAYKGVERCIFVEKYLENSKTHDLQDYKFYCFNGIARYVLVNSGEKGKDLCTDLFDMQWNRLPVVKEHPNSQCIPAKPAEYDKMVEIAETIGRWVNNPFSRIDLYDVDGHIYFGEITLYPAGGLVPFHPSEYDAIFGSWMDISKLQK